MTRAWRRSLFLSICLLVLLLSPGGAQARDEFQRHYDQAIKLYKAASYRDAITEFQAAYDLRQLPRLLLNIGQAYRKLGYAKEALQFYEHYLRVQPHPDPKIRADLDSYIAQSHALLMPPMPPIPPSDAPPPPEKPVAPPPPPVQIAPAPAPAAPPITVTRPHPPPPPPERAPHWKLGSGIAFLLIGGGLVGLGGASLGVNGQCVDDACDRRFSSGVAGGVETGIGVAVLAAGITLVALDVRQHRHRSGGPR